MVVRGQPGVLKGLLKQAKDAKASKAVFGKSVVLHTKGKQNKKNLADPVG